MAGSDLYTGSLDLIILKSLTFGPMHGYAIGRWIRQTTSEELAVQEGALYPALHRLERKGFLAEEWGMTDTNREAKFYRLTTDGITHLKTELARWHRYARVMTTALSAAPTQG
ncbi:MAG: transcriptional regulator, PadR-family [Gemmatimonadetes bacterium]|nr:transcriptional regulator, PadR-family [Gemmatimonadota bacterium]